VPAQRLRRAIALAFLISIASSMSAAATCAADYHYGTPVQPNSPWPTMRHDRFNTVMPAHVIAYVVADVFPLATRSF
jgi:hypothetical protein